MSHFYQRLTKFLSSLHPAFSGGLHKDAKSALPSSGGIAKEIGSLTDSQRKKIIENILSTLGTKEKREAQKKSLEKGIEDIKAKINRH